MQTIKKFFSITESFRFEIFDLTALITILNVALIILGFWWAPILRLVNCFIITILNVKQHAHINAHLTQIALVILNIFFLTM